MKMRKNAIFGFYDPKSRVVSFPEVLYQTQDYLGGPKLEIT